MERKEGQKPKSFKEGRESINYSEIAKEVADFANEVGENNYRHKTEYIALEFYRTTLNDQEAFLKILRSSDILRTYIDYLLRLHGFTQEEEIYAQEYTKEEEIILRDLNIENRDSFKNFIEKISNITGQDRDNIFEKEKAGMLTFNNHFHDSGELEIHIHLPSKTNKEDEPGPSPAKIKESLETLCDKLVEEKKAPRNITAQSWLMGVESIRKRMEFDVLKVYEFDKSNLGKNERLHELTPSIWGQFVDKDGKVKFEEVFYLFQHGEPRYNLTKAGISFAKFIEIYGRKYRGKTIEFLNFEAHHSEREKINRITGLLNKLIEDRDRKAFDEFLVFARENEFFGSFLDMEVGLRFVQLTREALEKEDPEKFLRENKSTEMTDIGRQFNLLKEQYLESVKNKTITMTL